MALKQKTSLPHLGRLFILLASTALFIMTLFSCSIVESKIAVIWTDSPEIQLAAELFNVSQTQFLVELHYHNNLGTALTQAKTPPSIVFGKNLRQPETMARFQPLDFLFDKLAFSRNDFYPALLDAGKLHGKTRLLPVSFNMLMLMHKKGALESLREESPEQRAVAAPGVPIDTAASKAPSTATTAKPSVMTDTTSTSKTPAAIDPGIAAGLPATPNSSITIEEIRTFSQKFNKESGKGFTAMGFVPRKSSGDFLFQWVQWMGADFSTPAKPTKDSLPVQWDQNKFPVAITALQDFSTTINGSADKENAFIFAYATARDYQNSLAGRTLFSAMKSSDFFTLPSQLRNQFEFNYVEFEKKPAVYEDVLYAGIPNGAKAKTAASQFLAWLFTTDTQRLILEKARSLRVYESEFGITGGFSAFIPGTSMVLPEYYPELRGRVPKSDRIVAPAAMPLVWKALKEKVLIPWLDESAGRTFSESVNEALTKAFKDYLNVNPELSAGK